MLIIVKERTNEIGIRKAVGALPTTIINLVLSEAVTITMLAGVIGIILGTGVLYLIDFGCSILGGYICYGSNFNRYTDHPFRRFSTGFIWYYCRSVPCYKGSSNHAGRCHTL